MIINIVEFSVCVCVCMQTAVSRQMKENLRKYWIIGEKEDFGWEFGEVQTMIFKNVIFRCDVGDLESEKTKMSKVAKHWSRIIQHNINKLLWCCQEHSYM